MALRNKLILLGNQCVGKSSLIKQLGSSNKNDSAESSKSQFSKVYSMTLGSDVFMKSLNVSSEPPTVCVELYIHDMGGHDSNLEYIPKYVIVDC